MFAFSIRSFAASLALSTMALAQSTPTTSPAAVELTITIDGPAKPINADLFGVFFEDLNYAADGGLYAELVTNRSFAYQATEQPTWNSLTGWTLVKRGGGDGSVAIDDALPLHANNPTYAVIHVAKAGDGVGLSNEGFDGVPVVAGERYDFSCFARQLYMNDRWGPGSAINGKAMPMVAQIETRTGEVIGEATIVVDGRPWRRIEATITASRTDPDARLVLLAKSRGGVALDEISLFPHRTFKGRKNGLRADLAQAIADLRPRFVRFPGGCLAHGGGLSNLYRWKETIGPIEQRRGQRNLWGYHQSVGLGYFEYFQFCEDIGAKPLPVVAAGVTCQNAGHVAGEGQMCIPIEDMPAYVQEVLDLIEYANGPATSTWGAKRAAAGHPEPFELQYLGVGNEDHITPGFAERFKMIFDAVRAKHPEITVIGTAGPSWQGEDYEKGWQLARELKVPIVDEHYYVPPDWFWEHLTFYDGYDRAGGHVYLGEYAAHDRGHASTLRAALAEAAYMTSLERNGDVVRLASYAPLLAKRGHTQWRPDLIYFDNTSVSPTLSYAVQKLFSENAGDRVWPTRLASENRATVAAACVQDSSTGDVIVKLVSRRGSPTRATIDLAACGPLGARATVTTLVGDPDAADVPTRIEPSVRTIDVERPLAIEMPAHGLVIVRIPRGDAAR